MKVGIFGGSFDPIHNGHIQIIGQTGKIFDRVIVLPAYRSPFKDTDAADARLRLSMCREETAGFPHVEVSDYELNLRAPAYTADTLAHFERVFGEPALIAGSDSLYTLAEWYKPEILARYPIYIFKRAGYTAEIEQKRNGFLSKYGGRIEIIDYTPEDISSSEIKVAAAFGSLRGLTGGAAERIIRENNLYCAYRKYAEGLSRYGLKEKRLEHIKNTALTAVRLAKIHGADTEKAAIAALLHDAGKYLTLEEARARGYAVDRTADAIPDKCVHAEISAAIAVRDFGVTDGEIISAIRNHVTGYPAMGKLDEIVFIADYIEPGRYFPGVAAAREAAAGSLTAATLLILEQTVRHLEEKGGAAIDKRTFETLEYYKRMAP